MSVSVENLENSLARLTIEVSAEDFEQAMQQAYQKQRGSISIPGFRKGKVPRAMVEKMYGPGVFYEEAANTLLPTAYADAAKESELDIVSRPEIDITQIEKGKPMVFTATVALKPEVELGTYKGVKVPKTDTTVTEEEIDEALKKEQEKNGRLVTMDDTPAEDGDTVTLDYEGKIDGVAFEGGTAQGQDLKLGSGSFIPGFEEQLIGLKAGEEKDVVVTFPESYHAEDLQGKEAIFSCKINKVSRTELPDLDDDFAQDVSEFDTLEEYKADLKKQVQERKEEQAKQSRRDEAVSRAARDAKMEIPKQMLDTRCDEAVENFARRLSMQGMNLEQYMQYTGSDRETMREQLKPQTEIQIRNELVLEKVAEVEKIEATEEEVENEIEEMAKAYSMEVDKLKELLSEEEKESIRKELAVRKAIDFLADNAVEEE